MDYQAEIKAWDGASNWEFLRRPRVSTFLLICLSAKALLTIGVFASGFWAFGGDDWGQLTLALDWAHKPTIAPQRTWLPLQFWALGSMCMITGGDIYRAALTLNILCSIATTIMLYLLARYLFNEVTARMALILFVSWPWNIWPAISPQTEAMYHCCFLGAAYSLIRWQREARARWLVLAAASCIVLTGLRYQGWVLVLMLVGYLVATRLVATHRRQPPWLVASLAGVMLFFPAFWLGYNAVVHGDPLYWMPRYNEHTRVFALSTWISGGRFLVWVFVAAPLLSPFLVAGVGRLRRLPPNEMFPYAIFCYGYILALVAYGALTRGQSPYVEQRYVVPSLIAAMPLAASLLLELPIPLLWRKAIILIICSWGTASSFRATHQYLNDAVIAEYLESLWKQSVLGEASSVFVHKRADERNYYRNDIRAIGVWSHKPTQVLGNSGAMVEEFEEALRQDEETTSEFLRRNRICVVLTDSPLVIDRLVSRWTVGGSLSGYKVFYDRRQIERPWLPPPVRTHEKRFSARWTNGIELVGVSTGGETAPEFPHFIIPEWLIPPNASQTTHAQWEFEPITSRSVPFTLVTRVANGLGSVASTVGGPVRISDRVVIGTDDPSADRQGRYRLSLTLIDDNGVSINLEGRDDNCSRLDVGSINIIRSKIDVLHSALSGNMIDFKMTAKVALSLIN